MHMNKLSMVSVTDAKYLNQVPKKTQNRPRFQLHVWNCYLGLLDDFERNKWSGKSLFFLVAPLQLPWLLELDEYL